MKKWTVNESGRLQMTYEEYKNLTDEQKAEIKANFSYEIFPYDSWPGKAWYVKPQGVPHVEVEISERLLNKIKKGTPELARDFFAREKFAMMAGVNPLLREIVIKKLGL